MKPGDIVRLTRDVTAPHDGSWFSPRRVLAQSGQAAVVHRTQWLGPVTVVLLGSGRLVDIGRGDAEVEDPFASDVEVVTR